MDADFWPKILTAAIAGSLVLWLFSKPWFWAAAGFLSGLAACFAMLASIVHFQILAGMGFFFAMAACWGIMLFALETLANRKQDQLFAEHRRQRQQWEAQDPTSESD